MKIRICKCCKKEITRSSKSGLCKSCSHKTGRKKYYCSCGKELINCRAIRCEQCWYAFNVGKNNSSYKDGRTNKKPFCIDCGIPLINYRSKRCKKCHYKFNRGKNSPRFGKLSFHGKGSYYKNIWFRSNWEVIYAKELDSKGIKWLYESKTFNLETTTYTPDFYLPESDTYVEIKGWWRDDAKEKFDLFKKLYPNIIILILNKTYFNKERIKNGK